MKTNYHNKPWGSLYSTQDNPFTSALLRLKSWQTEREDVASFNS